MEKVQLRLNILAKSYITKYKTALGKSAKKKGKKRFLNFEINSTCLLLVTFENLPTPFRRYITYRASTKAATQLVANPNLVKLLQGQEALARAALMEYECNQGNHSMFGFPENTIHTTYQPWRNLRR